MLNNVKSSVVKRKCCFMLDECRCSTVCFVISPSCKDCVQRVLSFISDEQTLQTLSLQGGCGSVDMCTHQTSVVLFSFLVQGHEKHLYLFEKLGVKTIGNYSRQQECTLVESAVSPALRKTSVSKYSCRMDGWMDGFNGLKLLIYIYIYIYTVPIKSLSITFWKFLKTILYAHQGCFYLIKNTVK